MVEIYKSSLQDSPQVQQDILHKNKLKPDKGVKEKRKEALIKTSEEIKGRNHPLSAFLYYPKKVSFINADPEEDVVLVLRRHPITNIGWVLSLIPLVLFPAFFSAFDFLSIFPEGYKMLFILAWYVVMFGYGFERFLSWYFNVNIITDERIIDVDFLHLIYREVTDANIEEIQEVTVELGGVIRTFFNYGNVVIQTAAESPRIEFNAVPKPDKVSRILRDLRLEEQIEKLEGRIR